MLIGYYNPERPSVKPNRSGPAHSLPVAAQNAGKLKACGAKPGVKRVVWLSQESETAARGTSALPTDGAG